jgi:hypothetical protein
MKGVRQGGRVVGVAGEWETNVKGFEEAMDDGRVRCLGI